MSTILKSDREVLVTLEDDGLVRKVARGLNSSRLNLRVPASEMVDREIRALEMLSDVPGIQRLARRESKTCFLSKYMNGTPLNRYDAPLPSEYLEELGNIIEICERRGIYRIGQNTEDYIVRPDLRPGIVDFGNVLFHDDKIAKIPGLTDFLSFYLNVCFQALKRKYSTQSAIAGTPENIA